MKIKEFIERMKICTLRLRRRISLWIYPQVMDLPIYKNLPTLDTTSLSEKLTASTVVNENELFSGLENDTQRFIREEIVLTDLCRSLMDELKKNGYVYFHKEQIPEEFITKYYASIMVYKKKIINNN